MRKRILIALLFAVAAAAAALPQTAPTPTVPAAPGVPLQTPRAKPAREPKPLVPAPPSYNCEPANPNAPNGRSALAYHRFYPGDRYVDILAADVYGAFQQKFHDDLQELANGRVIALGEVRNPPSSEVLKSQPNWVWFMGWSDIMDSPRAAEAVKVIFNDPRTRSRGEALPE